VTLDLLELLDQRAIKEMSVLRVLLELLVLKATRGIKAILDPLELLDQQAPQEPAIQDPRS
jgi:hypothetical protein